MDNYSYYDSPIGRVVITANENGLTGLWFDSEKNIPKILGEYGENNFISLAKKWLDIYFSGGVPDIEIPLDMKGSDFRMAVWEILRKIPYGKTVTYGDIAREIAEKRGIARMSAQAVGNAVGHNPISIIVPCHRVIGSDGSLTGYAGGLDRKKFMLELENSYELGVMN